MYHLHLPDNWELNIGVFCHITRIATIEETREMEQNCCDAFIYYYDHFQQLNERELDQLSCLLFRWRTILLLPRVTVKNYPLYKNVSSSFKEWFEQLATMYYNRSESE